MAFFDAFTVPGVAEGVRAGEGLLNFGLGVENAIWRRQAQQEAWRREDNAVQRRVADLTAAGLSPVLAAGSSAASSSPISTAAPTLDTGIMDSVRMRADISRTETDNALMKAQREKANFESKVYEKLNRLNDETGKPVVDALAFKTIQALIDQQEGISANAKAALTNSAALSRSLEYDISHGIFSDEARNNQALSTWLGQAKGKDLVGPGAQLGVDLLNMILSKRIPGRVPQK